MVGGGIYALTGKVAGQAGMQAPLSFILSALLALLTAFSYAELSARYPFSAGEVKYVSAAFSKRSFSILIGWLVVFMGVISAAALATATAGFIQDFIALPSLSLTAALVILLGLIAIWGIAESVWLVAVITIIEIGGLCLIVAMGWDELMTLPTRWPEMIPTVDAILWGSILSGAFLAFYAFIGFEDMVNIAEEVKDVRRVMLVAILTCIVTTLGIYILVMTVAVLVVPPQELAASNTPLALIAARTGTSLPPSLMGGISLLAIINGALVQVIMASRVLYGMAQSNKAQQWLGKVSARTHTPLNASLVAVALVMSFALFMDLESLARVTSAIILFVFATVNAALLKWSERTVHTTGFTTPWWVCLLGFMTCCAMLAFGIGKELSALLPAA